MEGDLNMGRFIYLIIMFVLSMVLVIIRPNLVRIILGWDGLGLVSYCLIIYYNNWRSYVSGMITIMFNRLGDIGVLFCIGLILNYGDWRLVMFSGKAIGGGSVNGLLGFFLVLAGITRRAQIPFCRWLPIAIAAPTPVSSLVHSSTLVTAGVYLLIRRVEGFRLFGIRVLLLVGGFTIVVSGLVANFEYDMRRIVALSTLSQLGLMIMVVSLGLIRVAFFHLVIHAFFKAMLFMCSGILIHRMGGLQDIRYMGGLFKNMPEVLLLILVSSFSLGGIPFFMGFYSRDLIMEVCIMGDLSFLVWFLFMCSVVTTVCYTVRMYLYIMFSWINNRGICIFRGGLRRALIIRCWFSLILVIWLGGYLASVLFPYVEDIYLGGVMRMMVVFFLVLGVVLGFNMFVGLESYFVGGRGGGFGYFLFFYFSRLMYMPSLSLWGSMGFMRVGSFSVKGLDRG